MIAKLFKSDGWNSGARKLMRTLTIVLILLFALSATPVLAISAVIPSSHCEGGSCCIESDCSCPNCWDRGEPGENCERCGGETCEHCGNCFDCGVSHCPACRSYCFICEGTILCATCNGCLDCGHNQDPNCPDCGAADIVILDESDGETPHLEPFIKTDGVRFYLFAPPGAPSWSILAVLLTLSGAVLATIITFERQKQRKEDDKKSYEHLNMLQNLFEFDNDKIISMLENEKRCNKRRGLGSFIVVQALMLVGFLLLSIMQDFNGVIVLFNWWVIPHALLFIGIVVTGVSTSRRYETEYMGEYTYTAAY